MIPTRLIFCHLHPLIVIVRLLRLRRSLSAPSRPAASAPAPENRAHKASRAPAFRRRPRRSSRHCRRTAPNGGRCRLKPCAVATWSAAPLRSRLLAATPPAATSRNGASAGTICLIDRIAVFIRSLTDSAMACSKERKNHGYLCHARAPAGAPPGAARFSGRRRKNAARRGRPSGGAGRSGADRRPPPSARPPARRESRGPAAWRSCRTPRPAHRRAWCRAADSGRAPCTARICVCPPETSSSR